MRSLVKNSLGHSFRTCALRYLDTISRFSAVIVAFLSVGAISSTRRSIHSAVITCPESPVRMPYLTHCQSCTRVISAVAASSMSQLRGMQPFPPSQAALYARAVATFERTPSVVI